MDVNKIIQRTWELVKQHRALWLLGFFAAFTEGTAGTLQPPSNFLDSSELPDSKNWHWLTAPSGAEIALIVLVGVLALIFFLVWLYLSYAAKAGLIIAANDLEEKEQKIGFGTYFHKGRHWVWRLFGLDILLGFIFFLTSLPFVIVCIFFALNVTARNPNGGLLAALAITAIVLFLLLLVWTVLVSIFVQFANRAVVLKQYRVIAAIRYAYMALRTQMGKILMVWLYSCLIRLALGLLLFVILLVLTLIGVPVGFLLAAIAGTTAVIVWAIIWGAIALAVLLIISSAYTAFVSTYWTLSYRAIDYLENSR